MTQDRMTKLGRPALFALAALPLTAGLVLAASGSGSTPSAQAPSTQTPSTQTPSTQAPQQVQPAQPATSPTQATRANYAEVYLQKLAAALGVSAERLKAAALSAGNATVDQAVGAGDLSADQAARTRERMQNDPLRFGLGRGGFGRGGHDHGPGGREDGRGSRHDHGERGQSASSGEDGRADGAGMGT